MKRTELLSVRFDPIELRGVALAAGQAHLAPSTWVRAVALEAAAAADAYPILDAWRDADDPDTVWVWCVGCEDWHHHSARPEGTRDAHCAPGRGFFRGRYAFTILGTLTPEIRARVEAGTA